jgi:heme exporter protein D
VQWHSLNEFLAMGGYGIYVWPSFGVTALCMIWEILALRWRRAAALRLIAQPSGEVEAPQ